MPLWHLNLWPGADYRYFDALSRLVRSSVFSYGRFPLHDPWMCGGLDLLANPQTRLFSPLGLLDLAFPAHTANVLSLVVHGLGGAFAGFALLRALARPPWLAVAGALAWLGGSWFMLHFSEGHIPYGAFQLLPAVALCFLRLEAPRAWLGLAALLALFLLDGGIYPFIFSVYLFLAMCLVGLVPLADAFRAARRAPELVGLALVGFGLAAAPKVVPVLVGTGDARFFSERTTLGRVLWSALFDPHQSRLRAFPALAPSPTGMHEYGCYLGWAALVVVLLAARHVGFRRPHLPWLALGLVFVWIGSNAGDPLNPWRLMQQVPLLGAAHVQSRYFVLAYLAWIVLVTGALRFVGRWQYAAAALIVLELAAVSFLGWREVYAPAAGSRAASETASLIDVRVWRGTAPFGHKPQHYGHGLGAFAGYEPAQPRRGVLHREDPRYRGEIYVADGRGTARLDAITPGEVALAYEGAVPARIVVNQNALAGWRVAQGQAEVEPGHAALVVRVEAPGPVVVRYAPWYWPWVLLAYGAGLAALSRLAWRVLRAPTA